ncbi:hypothetical protein [Sphingobium terrigena]|uniref:hypothetical protein n=1 Tax=Sphingobium terrigena TaxID=2304063 RepID=UPI001C720AA8|nr:hypothetical protein [Sphingobium terrigena]
MAVLEKARIGVSHNTFDCSALTEAELLYLIEVYDRSIAGDVISEAEAAQYHRLYAMIVRQGCPPQMDAQAAARVQHEYARTEQLGWRS